MMNNLDRISRSAFCVCFCTLVSLSSHPLRSAEAFLSQRMTIRTEVRPPLHCSASAATAVTTSATEVTGKGVRGIIFDIDGTLADSWELGYKATLAVLSDAGVEKDITTEEYHAGCRYTTPERLARHVGLVPGESEDFDSVGEKLGKDFDDRYVKLVDVKTAGFYDGMHTLLVKVNEKEARLGALTNACVAYAHAVLKANCPEHSDESASSPGPIYEMFTSIQGADSVPRAKPFPDGVLQCCKEMGLDPSECVYVGDAPTDGQAAAAAGCACAIGVLWGSNSEEKLREAPFDIICSSVEELEKVILGLMEGETAQKE